MRLTYADSCRRLQQLGLLDEGPLPPAPKGVPRPDDALLGVSFFRTELTGVDLGNLTLPRTFFGRSEVKDVSFANTDLSQSNLCWNDFIKVDFHAARLAGADMRSAIFEDSSFRQADLSGADMRGSSFDRCDFTDASMVGAIVSRTGVQGLRLSVAQTASLDLRNDDGPEPEGG